MMAKKAGLDILTITKNDNVIARGIFISEAVLSFDDNGKSGISYPDTGVFVLFSGSAVSSPKDKYEQYVDKEKGTTKKEIVFQSRNAAAQFVLGEEGRTNHWE